MNILPDTLETKVTQLYPLLSTNTAITLHSDSPLALARMSVELQLPIKEVHTAIVSNLNDLETLDSYYNKLDREKPYVRPHCDMKTFVSLRDYVSLYKVLYLIDERVYRGICLDLCHLYSSRIYYYKNLKPYKFFVGETDVPALYEIALLELCVNYLTAVFKVGETSMFHNTVLTELIDKIKEFASPSVKAIKIKNSSSLYVKSDVSELDTSYLDKTVNLYSFEHALNILGGFIESLYPTSLSRNDADILRKQLKEAEDTITTLSMYKDVVKKQGYLLKELFGANFSITSDVETQAKDLKEKISSKAEETKYIKRIQELEKQLASKDETLQKTQAKLKLANKRISSIYEDDYVEEDEAEEQLDLETIISELNSKFVLLVGGRNNLEEKLKGLGYAGFEQINNHNNAAFSNASGSRPNYDLVVLNTKHLSHSTSRGIESRYDNIIYFNGTNVDALLRSIYDALIKSSED